jgi:hypothetical protein
MFIFVGILLTYKVFELQGTVYDGAISHVENVSKYIIVCYSMISIIFWLQYPLCKSIYILGKNNLDSLRGVVAFFPDDNSAAPQTNTGNVLYNCQDFYSAPTSSNPDINT